MSAEVPFFDDGTEYARFSCQDRLLRRIGISVPDRVCEFLPESSCGRFCGIDRFRLAPVAMLMPPTEIAPR